MAPSRGPDRRSVRAGRQRRRRLHRRAAARIVGLSRSSSALLGDRARMRGDPALAAERWRGPVHAGEGFAFDAADLVIDALYGAGLSRDVDGAALGLRRGDQRLRARGQAGAQRRRALRASTARPAGCAARRSRRAPASPSSASSPATCCCPDARCAAVSRSPTSASATSALAAIAPQGLRQRAGDLARRAAAARRLRPQIYARRGAGRSPAPPIAPARRGWRRARRCASARGSSTLASPPDAVAVNAAQSTAVMVAPFAGLAGFARLLADPRRNAVLIGPGAGVGEATRGLVAAALTEPSAEPRAIVLDADALTSFAGDAGGLAALIAREGARDDRHAARRRVRPSVPRPPGSARSADRNSRGPAPPPRRSARSSSSRAPTPSSPRPTAAPRSASICRRRSPPPVPATCSPGWPAACWRRACRPSRRRRRRSGCTARRRARSARA